MPRRIIVLLIQIIVSAQILGLFGVIATLMVMFGVTRLIAYLVFGVGALLTRYVWKLIGRRYT
jgi:hypothetical protein